MSQQKIPSLLKEQIGKLNPNSPFYLHSESTLNFDILSTKKARSLLSDYGISIDVFAGKPKINVQLDKTPLKFPEHLENSDSDFILNQELEDHVMNLIKLEELSLKIETTGFGGIFKWLPKDGQLLLITIYKIDASRGRNRKNPYSPLSIKLRMVERSDVSIQSYPKQMAKLLYYTLMELRQLHKEIFGSSYKKFLDHYFQPFEDFLYNEQISIRDPKYRPKCKYTKRVIDNAKFREDKIYIEVEDPPRQMIEAGNAVVPASDGSNVRFFSARISDYDEFNSLLIFEEGYKIKEWPEKGTLILEGDIASNRRKRRAIRQIKSRGIQAHAKLADVLMRPWGLPEIIDSPRSYFNKNISHDDPQSKPQAIAIDIALSNNDVTLIHGPPGTGKTTVIVEIIRHVTASGGRVIMCAPTHVAVDNVLERILGIKGISAVRIGGTPYMDDELSQFKLNEKAKSLSQALPSFQYFSNSDDPIKSMQEEMIKELESKGTNYLEQVIIEQSNLVCGTTIGIARFEPPSDNPVDFDVMIIDEASKTTVMEFLVPAVRAKKWILVGDHRQLPPYVNEQEIRIYVQKYFDKSTPDGEVKVVEEEDDEEVEEVTIYDDKTNQLIASLRRFHEETHALTEGQTEFHWNKIVELFENSKRPIKGIEEMVNFALGSCFHYFLQRVDETRNARLIVQHRMPSILADFLDKEIYKGNLKTSQSASTHGLKLPPVPALNLSEMEDPLIFVSTERLSDNMETPGRYKGYHNTKEAEIISELVEGLSELDEVTLGYSEEHPMTIGVITYYAGQSREINRHLRSVETLEKERGWRYKVKGKNIKVRVSIVDRFQGQEQDIVILSLTRSNNRGSIGFLKNLQRVNVSLSRAKQNLLIVGNARFFANNKNKPQPILKQLAKYAIKNKLVKYVQEDEEE